MSLLSLGAMCAEGWKRPRWNPGGVKIVTTEVRLLHMYNRHTCLQLPFLSFRITHRPRYLAEVQIQAIMLTSSVLKVLTSSSSKLQLVQATRSRINTYRISGNMRSEFNGTSKHCYLAVDVFTHIVDPVDVGWWDLTITIVYC